MLDILIVIAVIVFILLRWSRYYSNKQIKKSLKEVNLNKPYRSLVSFKEYLRYFKFDMNIKHESIQVDLFNKNITIIKDENETVLYIESTNVKIEDIENN